MEQKNHAVEGGKHFVMAYLQHLVNLSALKNDR